TTPIKCVYGQDMNKIDMRDYVKNTDVVGEVTVKVATGSTLPDGMKLDGSKLSGKPAKAYEDGKEVTFTFTAENGSTANLTLLFLVAKADPTVEVAVSGDSHTEGDLVSELKLILSENSTKGVVELVSEIKALVAGKNTLTWKFTPEDENNYNMVTGTVVVNAQTTTTTTTTTKATTTTTKATTTTKPNKMTTTNVTTTMKSSKTTTTKATTTTKPSKTTTTNATTTTKPNKTTTTKVTTTTKPNKTTTTKATTTTTTTISSYGDVNLDGKVDIVDAIFLNKYLATLIQFSDAQVANADCYQDGVLNDQDTTALMQFIILLIDDLPVQPTEK
ncbi:MAG: dockerin type I repeat-containing protein, partial [Anaerobutyricum soehngenii]